MRRIIHIGLLIALSLSFGESSAKTAQFYKDPSASREVIVDIAQFAGSDSSKIRLEIYYQFYTTALEFEEKDGKYSATYNVSVIVRGKNDSVAAKFTDRKTITVATKGETIAVRNFRTKQFNAELDPGKYTIYFHLSDENGPLEYRRKIKKKIKKILSKKPRLSDIELVQAAGPQKGEGTTSFSKGNLSVVPSLTHAFTSGIDGKLLFYIEIYQGSDSSKEINIETSLRHSRKGLAYRDTLSIKLDEPITRQLREISLTDFRPGEYELRVRLRERRFKKIHERSTKFVIQWTFLARLQHDYKTAIDQLSYLSDASGLKELRKIEDLKERIKAFNAFWAERDPDPSTPINEMKVSFYNRLAMADKLFSISIKEGWRSDRGRIYVRYGQPDEIDDYPITSAPKPYQIWHYYDGGRYRRFVFIDENEDGDFRLQYPYDGLNQRPDF